MRIFVSYNVRDEDAVVSLVRRLAAARADCDVYYAPEANAAGAFWIARVGEEISTSDVFLLFFGRRIGTWQELEYYEALRQARTLKRPRIVPILLEQDVPRLHFVGQFHRLRLPGNLPTQMIELIGRTLEEAERGSDAESLWRQTNPYLHLFSVGTTGAAHFLAASS